MIRRVPSKPGRPKATHDRGIYVTVGWTEPEDSGGADLTGYVIKYRGKVFTFINDDSDSESNGVGEYDELSLDGNITNFQFSDQLHERTSYRFAVAAVNAVGRGEFSEFTDNVLAVWGNCCCNYHNV